MSKSNNNYILPILYIVVGILFCVFQSQIVGWILTIAGILFIANGIIQLVNNDTQNGIINLIIGVLVIVFGWTLLWLAMLVFGVLLIISAVTDFSKGNKNIMSIVELVVTVIVGVLLITNGFATLSWLFIVIGVVFIIQGILNLLPLLKK